MKFIYGNLGKIWGTFWYVGDTFRYDGDTLGYVRGTLGYIYGTLGDIGGNFWNNWGLPPSPEAVIKCDPTVDPPTPLCDQM